MIPYIGSADNKNKPVDPGVGFFLEEDCGDIYLAAMDSHGDTWGIVWITGDGLELCPYIESEDIPTEGTRRYIPILKQK